MIGSTYKISNLTQASEALLMHDVYLVLLDAARTPPHLALVVNGKVFTLGVKGPTIEGDLGSMLRIIRQRRIESIFIKLSVPHLFTIAQLEDEIKKYMLSYPRVDVGLATCLAPIRDFCGSVFDTETRNVNYIFDLLPRLEAQQAIHSCYHLNLEKYLRDDAFLMKKYTMEDINEQIRKLSFVTS